MASRIPNNRLLLGGLIIFASLTALIAFLLLRDGDDPGQPDAGSSDLLDTYVQLESWPVDDARTVSLSVDPKRGPIWKHADDTVVLTPESDELSFDTWTVETTGEQTRVVGSGTMGRADVSATWTFVQGNPQAHLALAFDGLSSNRLASSIELIEHRVAGVQENARLVLWQPITSVECDEDDEPASFDLRTQRIVTLQQAPDVSSWRYSSGASAQLVPVFDVPSHHGDPQLNETSAKTAAAWLRRARTLIYGHSNPKDPRYGNGGLLGHSLGATIAVPAKWADHPDVLALAADLKGSHVEIAPRGEALGSTLQSTRFAVDSSCRTWVELSDKGVPAAMVGTVEPPDDASQLASTSSVSVSTTPLLATVVPVQLDGQRSSLLARGLDTNLLDQVVRQRASHVFSTPFVATRNPLIGAAKEGLLEPERDGQWTVAAEVSEALANLELWREATPLLVTSVGASASRTSASRQVLHWWTAQGDLRVRNPSSKMIGGYTLVIAGSASATVEGSAISSRRILLDGERQATLLWWDLEPGTHTLQISDTSDELVGLTPVDWQINAP
jgi:hypothetical protein